ncbi:MAG: hypothetical protein MUC87_18490 [Bacteroidia bacterium]|jgi:hypothetical protein|nr:hypothetical protein [Bacteroidia bacterium]
MTIHEAHQIVREARMLKIQAQRINTGPDRFAVSFGRNSEHLFRRFEAAQSYLLAWKIERVA